MLKSEDMKKKIAEEMNNNSDPAILKFNGAFYHAYVPAHYSHDKQLSLIQNEHEKQEMLAHQVIRLGH